jgi:hypothetical protein
VSPIPADYVGVAERIRQFKAKYPHGSLQTSTPELFHVGDKTFVCVQAYAYRDLDDALPGMGTAWEPVPGPTPFTRDSELMNAETSAWGRAIVALGFETKKIASADEVANRQGPETSGAASRSTDGGTGRPAPEEPRGEFDYTPDPVAAQRGRLIVIHKTLREQVPRQEGQESWAAILQKFSYETFGKIDSKDLNEGELSILVDYANGLLRDEGVAEVT